jgi:hypothetical protein
MPSLTAAASILAVVDDSSRECLSLIADTSLSGQRVVRELDTIIAARAADAIVSDKGRVHQHGRALVIGRGRLAITTWKDDYNNH